MNAMHPQPAAAPLAPPVDLQPKEGPAEVEAPQAASSPAAPYDAIVIGSGMGGLTTAALLARQRGWRVLILEQHFTVGGMTHAFRRGRFHFDVGLHYVGNLHPGSQERRLYDYLTDGTLQWTQMPDEFERFLYPGLDFRVPSKPRDYQARLVARFPAEAEAIARYFKDVRRASLGYVAAHVGDTMPAPVRGGVRLVLARAMRLAGMTTQAYLERTLRDPELRALLASQWGDYGLPPSESLFGIHAMIVQHYLRGAWYPVGGAQSIARAMLPAILAKGGKALAGRRVTEIVMEGGRAVGVKVQRTYRPDLPGEEYRAPVIVSDAGVYNTYLKLLPASAPVPFRAAVRDTPPGYSAVTLYVGLKASAATLGVRGENLWIFQGTDHEQVRAAEGVAGSVGGQVYVSFPSMKTPDADAHTAEVISFVPYDLFQRWADQPWKQRDAAYQQLKAEISGTLLNLVEEKVPGIKALVEFQELSTPVSVEHFQGSPHGAFYGMPARPGRLFAPWTRAASPVSGLYLTGQDVMSLGIVGAMMGGVKCAGVIEGRLGFLKVMGRVLRGKRRPQA